VKKYSALAQAGRLRLSNALRDDRQSPTF